MSFGETNFQRGEQVYSWDAENCLVVVEPFAVTNGDRKVQMDYDHLGRMVRLTESGYTNAWTAVSTRYFVWHGWNPIAEIETDLQTGQTNRTFYVWGPDISGTPQSAGGVGGLVAVVKDQQVFVPCYDGNGNITEYVDSDGAVVARYRYDPFGIILESSGSRADEFRFRFSTKYHEPISGLVLYQKRAYCPELGRWLNRDPIGEDGGLNLYAFCGNNPVDRFDKLGEAYFAYRVLDSFWSRSIGVVKNVQVLGKKRVLGHVQIFFEDGKYPSNLGFFATDEIWMDRAMLPYETSTDFGWNDCILRKAVQRVKPQKYSLRGYNCQDWSNDVQGAYFEILLEMSSVKECCVGGYK